MAKPVSPSPAKPRLLVISDGRRGIENQALGLAEALCRIQPMVLDIATLKIPRLTATLPALWQARLKSQPKYYGLSGHIDAANSAGIPDIIIGCGRRAIAPLLVAKRQTPDYFTVYIQDPRIPAQHFDRVVSPQHDACRGDNVITIIGSPNRITPDRLQKAAQAMPIHTEKPKALWLIGGPSKTHTLPSELLQHHLQLAKDILAQDYQLLISPSRRTPKSVLAAYETLAKAHNKVPRSVTLYDGLGPNPYFAWLAQADIAFITEDSTNMLTEVASSGTPAYRLPMAGKPGKFTHLYDSLSEHCHINLYRGGAVTSRPYAPLHETDRAAQCLWTYFQEKHYKL